MKISFCLPYMESRYDRSTTLDWCRLLDQGPFASLSCGERIISATQDMRIVLGAAAALTERIRIIPSLYVLPMHPPVLVAKELATLDVLSNGRVTATLGVGGREQDYRALGASMTKRLQRLDDGVAMMKRVWTGESPMEGVDPVGPMPVQPGGPPLWAGAMQPKAVRRAAEWAQGVYGFTMNGDTKPVREHFALVKNAWKEAKRPSPYLATGFWFSLSEDADAKLKSYAFEYLRFAGDDVAEAVAKTMKCSTEQAVTEALEAIAAEGCDECFLVPATLDLAEIERTARIAERFRS
jgi:alkanesulfonate monooxygenase SsuD/methylene tetrahydromethanopterin reductase-like flavin-dependent oxidoreductase (luciferase family)